MTVVKGSVIGFLNGKPGHLAARTVKGRTIHSARPASFNARLYAGIGWNL